MNNWHFAYIIPIAFFLFLFFFGMGLYWGYFASDDLNCTIEYNNGNVSNASLIKGHVENKTFWKPLFICDVTQVFDDKSPEVYIGYYDCNKDIFDVKPECSNDYLLWRKEFCWEEEKELLAEISISEGGGYVVKTADFAETGYAEK